ncbi:bifunctional 3,4-dihydroxy-2-butanone-4-phosphate synthase/GTP cyclohydrolase II [Aliikangiella coralliicola]|uniref:3,4-dihydroxy-2-butanone 4-phosphate synthase n=1 Tax=Aliikangiella coralliicola TaxID=2592383 RepID=A0A545U746_9GAMM|nr:bifunctional 3,4-dihydroxy-2-butanone-4-phosphate synthase/GTP cyclohydrolase II [Aliikangiella coralliicola]TQV85296.1 3,4-dihydroxy-2-butanone-4-phosphate synthase [Aliikangiella coralliicola]
MQLNTAKELIEDIAAGKMVILMDDEDRENEGDLVMASSMIRPEDINFMARYGRGLICLTLTQERCEQLRLPLMVGRNSASFETNFTVSIEAAEGVTTGISAADRARTIQAAVAANAQPTDIVQPGHIFPIMAKPGGVLNRAGHTEAGCDLARLAGLEPSATIVEILNEDGTMARRSDLEKVAQTHGLKIGTIADLIEYRMNTEHTIEQVLCVDWPTEFGEFKLHVFKDSIDGQTHIALVKGDIKPDEPTLVRVHVTDIATDLLAKEKKSQGSWTIQRAIEKVADAGEGVVVLLGNQSSPESIIDRIAVVSGQKAVSQKAQAQASRASRTVGIGSQILMELGVHKMRLLSPVKKYRALSGFNLEVVEFIEDH